MAKVDEEGRAHEVNMTAPPDTRDPSIASQCQLSADPSKKDHPAGRDALKACAGHGGIAHFDCLHCRLESQAATIATLRQTLQKIANLKYDAATCNCLARDTLTNLWPHD